MLVLMSIFGSFFADPLLPRLSVRVPVWLGAGLVFGIVTWIRAEREYLAGTDENGAPAA